MAAPGETVDRAYLIDSSIYIFRAWFSMPDQWHSPEGWPLNAVYGYTRFLLEFLESNRPIHCAAAFDESLGSCFRNDILPTYKSSRELPDEALAFQLNACREVTERLGIPSYGGSRYEADDYLATLARLYRVQKIPVSIMTRDKDLGQILAGDGDLWWDYGAALTLDADGFAKKFGVRPRQFADYLALLGDPIDDIPGVPGVGAKTAAKLLRAFDDLEQLGQQLDSLGELGIRGAARIEANLRDYWPQVQLARQLTVLDDSVPGVYGTPAYALTSGSVANLAEYLEQLNLPAPLLRRCRNLETKLRADASS